MNNPASPHITGQHPDHGSALASSSGGAGTAKPSPDTLIDTAAAQGDICVQPLCGHVTILSGSGGNTAVLSGPTARYDAVWGHSVIDPALFTAPVYRGV